MLENNRELLDTIVCALINKQILRAPDIEDILEKFNYSSKKESLVTTITPTIDSHNTPRIVAKDWGLNSRRPSIRWIDMRQIRGGSEL